MNDTSIAPVGYSASSEEQRTEAARSELASTEFDVRSVCLVLLTIMAGLATLYVGAPIILPFLLAIVLNLLLSPAKQLLTGRLRLPPPLAALLLVAALSVVVAGIGYAAYLPASGWIAKVPESLPKLQERLGFLKEPVQALQHGAEQVQKAMEQTPADAAATTAAPVPVTVERQPGAGGLGLSILSGTRVLLGQVVTVVVTLFFLLTSGETLLRSLVEILPSFGDKRRAVEIVQEIERGISGYLVTITMMNALVGVATGLAMWALGVANPLLWGTLAFLLNYIPILGPLTGVVIFFFVGLFTSPTMSGALAPAGAYLVIHVVEGETVTPMLLAKRFTLNPVLVIMALFFWDWLWGVPGAILAVPVLATAKIVCDRIPALMPFGHLLGGSPRKGERDTVQA
ncbi:MAG TPA: AI-2E family transporter [Acetobacteraceae bacterium]